MKQLLKVWKYSSDMCMLSRIAIFVVWFVGLLLSKFILLYCLNNKFSINSFEVFDISLISIIPYIIWIVFLIKMGKDLKKEKGSFIFIGSITKKSYMICQNIILFVYELLFLSSVILSGIITEGEDYSLRVTFWVAYGILVSIIVLHFIILPAVLVAKSLVNKKAMQVVLSIIMIIAECVLIGLFEFICEIFLPLVYLNIQIGSHLYSFDILSGVILIVLYLVFNIIGFKLYENKLEIK